MHSAPDLFPAVSGTSPHADWLREHNLITREYQHPHSLNGSARWICSNRAMTRYCGADIEDAAEQGYCEMYGLDWWKLGQWNEAMSPQGVADLFRRDAERIQTAMGVPCMEID